MGRSAALLLYEKVVAQLPGIERKWGTMPYTSVNGHMFSVLHEDVLSHSTDCFPSTTT